MSAHHRAFLEDCTVEFVSVYQDKHKALRGSEFSYIAHFNQTGREVTAPVIISELRIEKVKELPPLHLSHLIDTSMQ
jgi:hypothetical protein